MRTLLVVALAGCGFHGPALTGAGPTDGPSLAKDGDSPAPDLDAARDAPATVPFCDPGDGHLVACYPFEGNANDGSAHGLNSPATSVSFVAGRVGLAMQFGATSAADVADSAAFDVAALTIEAFIFPNAIPATGARQGVVDNNGQYGFFLHELGQLQCTIVGGPSLRATANVVAQRWTHVACTFDGTTTTIYVDGKVVGSLGGGGTLATSGNTGISLAADNPPGSGSRLIGMIDQVRLFDRARSASEICADAQPATCP